MANADANAALRVQPADLSDVAQAAGLLEVLDAYARDRFGGGTPLAEDALERLVPALRSNEAAHVFVAIDGERVVGAAVCFRGFSTFSAQPLLNVHDLAVRKEYRGRGLGRRLLAIAEDFARAQGYCKLTLEVAAHNERALGLYRTFGFGDYGPDDDPAPTLFLHKSL